MNRTKTRRAPEPKDGKIAAIYCRKSDASSGEARGRSTSQQLEQCLMAARMLGYHVPEHQQYVDQDGNKGNWFWESLEANHPGPHRPELTRLMQSIESGDSEISAVIVWRTDRLYRDEIVAGHLLRTLQAHGVRLYSRTQDLAIHTASGYLAASTEACSNKAYRDKISEDVCRSHEMRAAAGLIPTDASCLGFRSQRGTGKVVPIPEEIEVVRAIFRWYLHGDPSEAPLSARAITRRCMERGLRASVGAKGHRSKMPDFVHQASVVTVLRNARYAGWLRWNDKLHETEAFDLSVRPDGTAETVVSREDYEAAQVKLAESWPHERDTRAKLLSGTLACPDCGAHAYFASKQDGYRAIVCPTRRHGQRPCPRRAFRSLPMDDIEAWVRIHLAPLLTAELLALRELQAGDAHQIELARLERDLSEARARESTELAAYVGAMDAVQFAAVAAQLRRGRETIESQVDVLKRRLNQRRIEQRRDPFDLFSADVSVLREALMRAVRFIAVSQTGLTVLLRSGAYVGAFFGPGAPRPGGGPRRPTILPPSVDATQQCRSWIAYDRESFLVGARASCGRWATVPSDGELLPDFALETA